MSKFSELWRHPNGPLVSGISSTLGRAVEACAFCGAPNVLTATDATASAAKGVLILIVQAFSRKSGSEANAETVAGNDAPTFQNCYIYIRPQIEAAYLLKYLYDI